MAVFQSLGELSDWIGSRSPRVEIVDAGVPLTDLAGDNTAWNVWRTQPSVRKVVDFIARNVASVPLHVHERLSDTDRPRVTDHPLAACLGQPRPRKTPFRFWHSVLVDYLMFDRYAILKVPQLDGTMQLQRIPARRTRFESDGLDEVATIHVFTAHGRWEEYDPATCIYDHGYAPRGANGTSPMRTLRDLLDEQQEAVTYRRAVFANGARVPAIVKRPANAPDWSKDGGRDRFVESWKRYVRGGGREGGTPLLEDGMELEKIDAFKPIDTEALAGRQLTDAEVASAYHIAPELVGAREGTYSNVDAFRQMLYRDSLGATIAALEQCLNAMLVPDLSGTRPLYVEANLDVKLRGSFEEQAKFLQSATGAPWLTRNEGRARQNLPRIEGADELVVPLNVTQGGLASPRDTAPPPKTGRSTKARPDDLAPIARERDQFAAQLAAHLDRSAAELRTTLTGGAAPSLFDEWGDGQARDGKLADLVLAHTQRCAAVGAYDVLETHEPDGSTWAAEVMLPWLAKAAASHATRINTAGYNTLASAMSATDRDAAVAAALAGWVGMASTEATRIATEARSFGAHDAAQASGLTRKTWRTCPGEDRHAPLDGHTVGVAEAFDNGLRWPGDPTGGAEDTYGCLCTATYSTE